VSLYNLLFAGVRFGVFAPGSLGKKPLSAGGAIHKNGVDWKNIRVSNTTTGDGSLSVLFTVVAYPESAKEGINAV
jgi:hypothetical protein